jgi:vacuolar protein sorting-associated protein VTA1
MATPIPPVLKPITPYVQRGRELMRANGDEVIAYHCFKHAMDMGIKLNDKSPECQGFLMELMHDLETMKPHLKGRSQEDLKATCEAFGNAVFQRADAIDQAGNADKSTAQSFYAASSFFEILKQFDPSKELDPDIKQMVIYAKWKAADILKALKEGRKPTPGGKGGSDDFQEDTHAPPPVAATKASSPVSTTHEDVPVARPAQTTHASVTPPPSTSDTRRTATFTRQASSLSKPRKADCLEYIKFARAALEADDVALTVERLQAALALLHDA